MFYVLGPFFAICECPRFFSLEKSSSRSNAAGLPATPGEPKFLVFPCFFCYMLHMLALQEPCPTGGCRRVLGSPVAVLQGPAGGLHPKSQVIVCLPVSIAHSARSSGRGSLLPAEVCVQKCWGSRLKWRDVEGAAVMGVMKTYAASFPRSVCRLLVLLHLLFSTRLI